MREPASHNRNIKLVKQRCMLSKRQVPHRYIAEHTKALHFYSNRHDCKWQRRPRRCATRMHSHTQYEGLDIKCWRHVSKKKNEAHACNRLWIEATARVARGPFRSKTVEIMRFLTHDVARRTLYCVSRLFRMYLEWICTKAMRGHALLC